MENKVLKHWFSRLAMILIVCFAHFSLSPLSQAETVGPITGQVVDKETKKPLEGAVVLAVWRMCDFVQMHSCSAYYDAEEITTDPDGRFTIKAREFLPDPNIRIIQGPDIYIFKGSYGRWEFQGIDEDEGWKRIKEKQSVVLELPKLNTREERLEFARYPWPGIPPDKIRNYLRALDLESMTLGLEPAYSR